MAQNKITTYDISRSNCSNFSLRADDLKSFYSFCMELIVAQGNFTRPLL